MSSMNARGAVRRAPLDAETIIALALMAWTAYRAVLLLRSAWAFTTDDAFITLRYSRHLAEGHGIVWNVGEPPVEGYSNFLFVLVGAAALASGADPILCFKVLSVAALFGTLILSYRLARNWCGPIASVIPAFLLIRNPGTIFWTVSGLESAVYQLATVASIALAFAAFGFRGTSPRPALFVFCGSAIALGSLTRPEGPLLIVIVSIAVLGAPLPSGVTRTEAVARLWAGFGAIFVPYFAWRLWRYGRLLPNSAYCKLAYAGDPWTVVSELWEYGKYFVLLALVQSPRDFDVRNFVLWAVVVGYAGLLIGVDPILAYWNRLALPAIPPLLVLATVGMTNVAAFSLRWRRPRYELALVAIVVLVSFLTTRGLGVMLQSRAYRYASFMNTRRAVGEWLDRSLSPDQWFVTGDAGLIPYLAKAKAIDALCLNTREATEAPLNRDGAAYWSWILARRPEIILLPSSSRKALQGPAAAIATRRDFREQYRLERVFASRPYGYHYFAYRRAIEGA
jgi:hypothetical protein